ncbi:hypothetical protein PWT90_05425 [Aphanocladium album]|nr:hypothetical protein PWT90_05425 [Aphanocladium album]
MSNSDGDDRIKVYCTVSGLAEQAICELLRSDAAGSVAEVKELFSVIPLPDQRHLQIFQHQDETYKKPEYDEQSYFLIVDSANPAVDGVLLCNLKGDHGFPDAVREMPAMAGMSAASLGIANTNWSEVRENGWNEQEPRIERIAVYDNRREKEHDFLRLAEAVDYGLHYLYTDLDGLDPDEPPPLTTSLDNLFRYTAVELDNPQSIQDTCRHHQNLAKDKDLNRNIFATIDDNIAEEGVLLVQVQPRKELRCKLPLAGELLWWSAVGLVDWEEMTDLAATHSDIEYKWTIDRMTNLQQTAHAGQKKTFSTTGHDNYKDHNTDDPDEANSGERRFRYYRTKSGLVIASIDVYDIPSTITRQRQESDGVDKNGEMGKMEDIVVEELPWDFYLTRDASEETR